jgi:hypothetical protein
MYVSPMIPPARRTHRFVSAAYIRPPSAKPKGRYIRGKYCITACISPGDNMHVEETCVSQNQNPWTKHIGCSVQSEANTKKLGQLDFGVWGTCCDHCNYV